MEVERAQEFAGYCSHVLAEAMLNEKACALKNAIADALRLSIQRRRTECAAQSWHMRSARLSNNSGKAFSTSKVCGLELANLGKANKLDLRPASLAFQWSRDSRKHVSWPP